MKEAQAVREIRRISNEMQAASERAAQASARYEAHMTLYNVAVQSGDEKLIETERLNLHSFLDGILDAGFEIYSRKRKMNEILANVEYD